MLKFILPAAVLVAVSVSTAQAGGQPVRLGLDWDNRRVVHSSPRINQTIIIQAGNGNQASVTAPKDSRRRPQASQLGLSSGTELICFEDGLASACSHY